MRPKSRTRKEFLHSIGRGVRLALWLMIPLLILGYRVGGEKWGLVMVLVGLIFVPLFTLPFSVLHTYLLRLIGFRGPVASTMIGLILGVITAGLMRDKTFTKLSIVYGVVYGLIIGLGNTAIATPGLIEDQAPRTVEEQARADGLR